MLDLCSVTDTLIADADGVYHPGSFNDRLVPGLKGQMAGVLKGKWPRLSSTCCGCG